MLNCLSKTSFLSSHSEWEQVPASHFDSGGVQRLRYSVFPSLLLFVLFSLGLQGCQKKTVVEPQAEIPPPAEVAPQPQGFSKLEWKIVDKNKALTENPELVEVENDTNASGLLEAISQANFSAISRLNTTTLEYNSKLQSFIDADGAQEPKPQTFAEFNTAAKQNPNNIKGLYPWQAYAYDENTGKVTILEDRAEKRRMYAEIGREYPQDE